VVLIDDLPSFERYKAFVLDSYNNKDRTIKLRIQPSTSIKLKFTFLLSIKCLSSYNYCFSPQNFIEAKAL
jgi:hypothetical protein